MAINDDVVIIKRENSNSTDWKLRRIIIQLHPGKDQIVRLVTLRIANGMEMRRPVAKLRVCRLPVQDDEEAVEK